MADALAIHLEITAALPHAPITLLGTVVVPTTHLVTAIVPTVPLEMALPIDPTIHLVEVVVQAVHSEATEEVHPLVVLPLTLRLPLQVGHLEVA